MASEKQTNHLGPKKKKKKKKNILENEMIKFYSTFICESDTDSRVWNRRVAYIFIKISWQFL